MGRLVIFTALLVGCADGRSVALVTVSGQVSAIASFAVTVTLNGAKSQVSKITPPSAPLSLPPPTRLALVFDADKKGLATVHVDAVGVAGAVLASGDSGDFMLVPSKEVDVDVGLNGALLGDMSAPPDLTNPCGVGTKLCGSACIATSLCCFNLDTFDDGSQFGP